MSFEDDVSVRVSCGSCKSLCLTGRIMGTRSQREALVSRFEASVCNKSPVV